MRKSLISAVAAAALILVAATPAGADPNQAFRRVVRNQLRRRGIRHRREGRVEQRSHGQRSSVECRVGSLPACRHDPGGNDD